MDDDEEVEESATAPTVPEPTHPDNAVRDPAPEEQGGKPVKDGLLADMRKELDNELHPPKGVWLWRVIRGSMPF